MSYDDGQSVLNGLFLGRALAEGDVLGALPFFKDIVKAVKLAAPNLIREAAAKKLASVQRRVHGPTTPEIPYGTPPYVPAPPPRPPAPLKWIVPVGITIGGFFMLRRSFSKRRR